MKKKKVILSIVIPLLILLLGASYAFFDYYMLGDNQKIIAGEVYLDFVDKTDSISLTNIYPETIEEARSRDDNVITFTLKGNSTIENKDVYYEVVVNEGEEISGKTRFNPEHIVFDLIEVDENGNELTDVTVTVQDNATTNITANNCYHYPIVGYNVWVQHANRRVSYGGTNKFPSLVWKNVDPNISYKVKVYCNELVGLFLEINCLEKNDDNKLDLRILVFLDEEFFICYSDYFLFDCDCYYYDGLFYTEFVDKVNLLDFCNYIYGDKVLEVKNRGLFIKKESN